MTTVLKRILVAKNLEIGALRDALRDVIQLGAEPIDHWQLDGLRSMVRVMRHRAENALRESDA